MKIMFIVYHNMRTEARSQEILQVSNKLGETVLVSFSKPDNYSGCKCIVTGGGKRNYFSFIRDSIRAIKSEKPEVIILHDNHTAIILGWLQKFRKKIYVIYDSSELYIEKKKPKSIKMVAGELMRILEKRCLKYANVVIAANIERAKIMKIYFGLKEFPLIFDNVHKIEDEYNVIECEKKYGYLFTDDIFCIVYGGGIAKARMTFELAKTTGKLGDNYRLVVVGATTDVEKNEFYTMLKGNNITNVTYLGFIPRNEWRYLLNKANLSVSAFAQDTSNNINCASGKLYESLFERTPVLVSENPPLQRICSDYKVGVSTDNFKEGILELENNYDFYYKSVEDYIETINVANRIDVLARSLKEKIEIDINNSTFAD